MQRYNIAPQEQAWLEELRRRRRQRMPGVYLCLAFGALFLLGFANSQRMMHGSGFSAASGTIVALGTGSNGEPTFTAEFRDAQGGVHRQTEGYGYHYAAGDPRVGDHIGLLYRNSPRTGEFYSIVRGDGIVKWMFGPAAALMLLAALGFYALIRAEDARRRALIRGGERVPLELPRIGHRGIALPTGAAGTVRVDTWRLEGRVFDARQGEYVECASDWLQPPAPESIDPAQRPLLLVDRLRPSRRWLPVGALWRPPPGK